MQVRQRLNAQRVSASFQSNFPTVNAALRSTGQALRSTGQAVRSTGHAVKQLSSKAATVFQHSGTGGGNGLFGMMGSALNWLRSLLTGSTYDFRAKAGNVWENSVVGIALNFLQRTYPEAPLCIE